MTTKIIQSIKSIASLNEEEEKAFLSILEVRLFKKKEFLQQILRVQTLA